MTQNITEAAGGGTSPPAAAAQPQSSAGAGKAAEAKSVRCTVLKPLQHHGVDYQPLRTVKSKAGKLRALPADSIDLPPALFKQLKAAGFVEEKEA